MIQEITPSGPVRGQAHVPGSKSLANRALVCAALAKGTSRIRNASDSDDTALLSNALNQLGVLVRREGSDLLVEGTGGKLFAPKFPIPVGNAGTTTRFLLALSSVAQGVTTIEGSERMAERPVGDLLSALRTLGGHVEMTPGRALFRVQGGSLSGGRVSIRGDKSSQFLSALLMIAPLARGPVVIDIEGTLTSKSYVGLTLDVMRAFGQHVSITSTGGYSIDAPHPYTAADVEIEADASSASYPLAAAAITGGEVLVEHVRRDSHQGDAGFVAVLERIGCIARQTDQGLVLSRPGALRGIEVDMNAMPDVVPTLAAVALFAEGPTRITHIAHLRYKESDRLSALEEELQKLGAHVTAGADSLDIVPAPLHGGLLDTYDDHRLAMSFALIGLKVNGISIENPECVRKSYPEFWNELRRITTHTGISHGR